MLCRRSKGMYWYSRCDPEPIAKEQIGTADTSKGIVVKHKRQMLVVSYDSVPIMHGDVPHARNCDVKVVELRNGPRIIDDLASLVVRRNTMVHVELPQTACDIREFNAWWSKCIDLMNRCIRSGGYIVIICPSACSSEVNSAFAQEHVGYLATSFDPHFEVLSNCHILMQNLSDTFGDRLLIITWTLYMIRFAPHVICRSIARQRTFARPRSEATRSVAVSALQHLAQALCLRVNSWRPF